MALYETCIERVLTKDPITKKYFLGAFAFDELPKKISKTPCCFIINTHPRSKSGEHWLAFYYDAKGRAEFFDSYGNAPSYYNLESYIQSTSKGAWTWNKKKFRVFQNFVAFIVFYIYYLNVEKNDSLFFKQFISTNYNKNDLEILKILINTIKNI